MARFEQRISEDDVTAARKKIEAGASLSSAAAEIPCAPSTLSVRIRKAEAADADARGEAAIGENKHRAAHRDSKLPDARLLAAGEGTLPGAVGPVETMLKLVSDADASSEQPPTSPSAHMFRYKPADGESVSIGSWFPPDAGQSAAVVPIRIRVTDDHETAERWRAELSAGRFPKGSEDTS